MYSIVFNPVPNYYLLFITILYNIDQKNSHTFGI